MKERWREGDSMKLERDMQRNRQSVRYMHRQSDRWKERVNFLQKHLLCCLLNCSYRYFHKIDEKCVCYVIHVMTNGDMEPASKFTSDIWRSPQTKRRRLHVSTNLTKKMANDVNVVRVLTAFSSCTSKPENFIEYEHCLYYLYIKCLVFIVTAFCCMVGVAVSFDVVDLISPTT